MKLSHVRKTFISLRPIREIPGAIPGTLVELQEREFETDNWSFMQVANGEGNTVNYSVITKGGAIGLCLPRAHERHQMCAGRRCEEGRVVPGLP